MLSSKYGHLVKPLPVKKGPGGANADQISWLQGKDLEGLNLNFTWGLYSGLGGTGNKAATHTCIHMTSAWYSWGIIPTT
jgi:hypothetical protein